MSLIDQIFRFGETVEEKIALCKPYFRQLRQPFLAKFESPKWQINLSSESSYFFWTPPRKKLSISILFRPMEGPVHGFESLQILRVHHKLD